MTDGPPPAPETQEAEHPEKYVVEFVGPYSFRVPKSIEGNGYEILLNGVSVELKLGELEGERAAFQGSGAVEFPLDRHGLLLSQGVEIHFEEEYISSLPDDIEEPAYEDLIMGSKIAGIHKRLIEDSIEYYNHFVQCYKTTTQKYWMRQVTSNEILNFTIKKIEGGEVIDETGLSLTGGSLRMGFIDDQKINQPRQVLSEGTNVTLSRQLDLDAQDKHDLGDYRLSIIQSDLLFVFWTRREYTKMLEADGKSEEYAEDVCGTMVVMSTITSTKYTI